MPPIPALQKNGEKKGKSQLRSFQVKHHCYGTESNCTGHQSNMNWRYPTPAGRWSHLLWWFCHFSIQTRVFDVQLQHLMNIQFGQVGWAGNPSPISSNWINIHRRQEEWLPSIQMIWHRAQHQPDRSLLSAALGHLHHLHTTKNKII